MIPLRHSPCVGGLSLLVLVLLAPTLAHSAPCNAATGAPRNLAEVLDRVQHSPQADAVSAGIGAAQALEQQAAARPNPELILDMEDFAGTGTYASFGGSQSTLSFSQSIQLGGRREGRMEVAARETGVEKARARQELVRVAAVAKREVAALFASRRRVAITSEGEKLAKQMLAVARRRVEGGAGSTADMERATIVVATAGLDVLEAQRDLFVSSQRLVSLWGGDAQEAACIDGTLVQPQHRQPATASAAIDREADLAQSPTVAIAEAEVDKSRAAVVSARADATPDLAIGAGVRYRTGPDDVSAVAGLSVEVPIFDRNAGNIAAAEQQLFAAQARARVARNEAAGRISRIRQAVENSRRRAIGLATDALPAAERAYGTLSRAWQDGAASSLDVLDARRTLITLQLQHVDALADFYRESTLLEGALGPVSSDFENTDVVPVAAATGGHEEN